MDICCYVKNANILQKLSVNVVDNDGNGSDDHNQDDQDIDNDNDDEREEKKKKKRKKRKANIVERNSRAPSSCRPFIYQDRIPLPQSSVLYFFVFYRCICVFVCWFVTYFIYQDCIPMPTFLPSSEYFCCISFECAVVFVYLCVGLYHIPYKTEFCWLSSILHCPLHFIALHLLCNFIFLHLCISATVCVSFYETS